ncbi:YbaB/EbfC family nucleoid-associated protein [Nocardia sp. N2S4-5]|uniref:YbaB/EbfC family nucleoid-associated protein n=1 Tax=Nocardia sp. N2S4-5 TaxID=3351565 RepID=UPI0037D7581D
MERWEQDALRSANYGMRNQVDHMLDLLADQRTQLAAVQQQLDTARFTATSPDGSVEVTVDASGVLTDVRFSENALRGTAEQLSTSVTETGRAAARQAQEQTRQLLTPLADAMPDLPDLVPGAPSLRDPVDADMPRD